MLLLLQLLCARSFCYGVCAEQHRRDINAYPSRGSIYSFKLVFLCPQILEEGYCQGHFRGGSLQNQICVEALCFGKSHINCDVMQVADTLRAIMVVNPRKQRPNQRKVKEPERDPSRTRSGKRKRAQPPQKSARTPEPDGDESDVQIIPFCSRGSSARCGTCFKW